MTKLELIISPNTLECVSMDETTAQILLGVKEEQGAPVAMSSLLADDHEFQVLERHVKELLLEFQKNCSGGPLFATCNLVFAAPHAAAAAPTADRRPVEGVFRSPIRAIHTSHETFLSCFVHLQINDNNHDIHITALEYSRQHRKQLLRQEFGSWLLEEHIEQAVIATEPLGTVVFWNRFASELYQYTEQEAMGQNILTLTPSDVTQEQGAEIFGKLVKGQHWRGFFGVQRKDQSRFVAHVTDTPVLDHAGELKFVVGVSADYTEMHDLMAELKRLNADLEQEAVARTKQLLEREETLRMVGAAVKESETGVLITEEDFTVIWANDAVFRMLKRNEQEVVGSFPWDLPLKYLSESSTGGVTASHEEPQSADYVRQLLQSTDNAHMTAMVLRSETNDVLPAANDGASGTASADELWVSINAQTMTDTRQRMMILRDLTAQRQAQEAQLAAEKAAAASRTKTEMMQMLSHEFRTPLQGIMGVASTMLIDMKPEEGLMFESLSTILASSRLLLTLINNVLDLGKMDADQMHAVELSTLSVIPCIQNGLTFCEQLATLSEVRLVLENQDVEWTVKANRLRLEQILVNLISNAIKYTSAGTDVVVSVQQCQVKQAVVEARNAGTSSLNLLGQKALTAASKDEKLATVISVRDHGRGIPIHEMHHLFVEFTQLEISKEKDRGYDGGKGHTIGQSSGSGLGLSLVLKFVTHMNGLIWVNNCNDGGGAIFNICFLAGDAACLEEESMGDSSHHHALELSHDEADSFRVLIVDDTLINLKVMQRMLLRLGVARIKLCSDGSEAIEYIESTMGDPESRPNLILSDLIMPNLNGYELAKHVRDMAMYDPPPTIMACSADWTSTTEELCFDVGFNGVLRKPVVFSALKHFLVQTAAAEGYLNESY